MLVNSFSMKNKYVTVMPFVGMFLMFSASVLFWGLAMRWISKGERDAGVVAVGLATAMMGGGFSYSAAISVINVLKRDGK